MSFINKVDVLKEQFFNPDTGRRRSSVLQRMEFDRETFSITLEYTGAVTKFYTDDELHEKFPDGLPDNDEGAVMLFFNTSDAIRIIDGLESEAKRNGEVRIKKRNKDSSGNEVYETPPVAKR